MPTMAVVTILAAGAGLAFLVRSIISLEDAIDQGNEVSVQDYAGSAEAQRGIEVLEAKGIPSMIRHGGFRGGIYSVVVRPDQLTTAREILASEKAQREEGT